MKKAIKLIVAGVLVATTILMAVSCGKKCDVCGETSSEGKTVGEQFICEDCISDPLGGAMKGLSGMLG